MPWFTFWEIDHRAPVRMNLATIQWVMLVEFDEYADNAPVTVAICGVDGKERRFRMHDTDERRLERMLDYYTEITAMAVVA